jgi:hypothetical protein
MAKLLNCFPQKIEANLRSIFKDNLLWENDCTYNRRYTDKGVEKQCLYYNLEVLIFISYRIDTLDAKAFRQFIHSALRERLQRKYILPDNLKFYGLLQSEKSYCWN